MINKFRLCFFLVFFTFSFLLQATDRCILSFYVDKRPPNHLVGHSHLLLLKLDTKGIPKKGIIMNIWENRYYFNIKDVMKVYLEKETKESFSFQGDYEDLKNKWIRLHLKRSKKRKIYGYNCASCLQETLRDVFEVSDSCLSRFILKPVFPLPVYKESLSRIKTDPRFTKLKEKVSMKGLAFKYEK